MEGEMKQATIYRCTSSTDATDRANLYYIASPTAAGMQRDPQARQITVTNKKGKALALFAY